MKTLLQTITGLTESNLLDALVFLDCVKEHTMGYGDSIALLLASWLILRIAVHLHKRAKVERDKARVKAAKQRRLAQRERES